MSRVWTGSSPLARGTRPPKPSVARAPRLIPARAGNTSNLIGPRKPVTAHPRSRGEHCVRPVGRLQGCGSSPLARGTLPAEVWTLGGVRLIPARAGNTHPYQGGGLFVSAHPRSRGEHRRRRRAGAPGGGSSPLARGTPAITTAFTGVFLAHPRSRGEHPSTISAAGVPAGSSPLARGTQDLKERYAVPERLIPARAGNTRKSPPPGSLPSAHPRSRGEHAMVFLSVE